MVPTKMNQNWLPSIFNDFFNNEWMMKANATAPAINVIENLGRLRIPDIILLRHDLQLRQHPLIVLRHVRHIVREIGRASCRERV